MLKLLCKQTWAGGQVLQNEDNLSSVPGCLSGGERLCRVVSGSPAPEHGKLQCWHQSCCYRFHLQTALIFAIHYWECVFSACQVLVSQEVWSQLDSCQGLTCYGASNRRRFLGSIAGRQTYMDGKVVLLKLPEGTHISTISTLCGLFPHFPHTVLGPSCWITAGEELREDPWTGARFVCAVMRIWPHWSLLICGFKGPVVFFLRGPWLCPFPHYLSCQQAEMPVCYHFF